MRGALFKFPRLPAPASRGGNGCVGILGRRLLAIPARSSGLCGITSEPRAVVVNFERIVEARGIRLQFSPLRFYRIAELYLLIQWASQQVQPEPAIGFAAMTITKSAEASRGHAIVSCTKSKAF